MCRRACLVFAEHPLWASVTDEDERVEIFNEAIKELDKREKVLLSYNLNYGNLSFFCAINGLQSPLISGIFT